MITVFLLLPVLAILTWLYWYLLPGRSWRIADTMIVAVVFMLAGLFIVSAASWVFPDTGPLWSQIVSVTGSYAILLGGLATGLFWRRLSK